MIKLEKTEVWGFEHAIRGARNPMNSWDKSDSYDAVDCRECGLVEEKGVCTKEDRLERCEKYKCYVIGNNDLSLIKKLIDAGTDHRKFMRQIFVSVDITAPLYWWKEFDTYKVGTVANSTSTMHKIHSKPIELSDFSIDDFDFKVDETLEFATDAMAHLLSALEYLRQEFVETTDKKYWRLLIQLLPESYNQTRTVTMNYENIFNMYHARKNHKLDEWKNGFCEWVKTLPYGEELITEVGCEAH